MADVQLARDSVLAISEADIERRKKLVDIEPADLARIRELKALIVDDVDRHAAAFFDFLAKSGGAAQLFANHNLLEEAKRLKREHLVAMVQGDYGRSYAQQRVRLGQLYVTAQLEYRVFIGAFHSMLRSLGDTIARHFERDAVAALQHFTSFNKIAFLDLGIIVDVLVAERERTISLQQQALLELSTPTLQVRDRLLILPIIGLIDSHRAKQLTDGLLHSIRANRAKVVVLDITGVATVDSKVANHLIQTVAAARLMGAAAIVTGLSADVAQSLVALGVDLGSLNTVGDLQGGLEEAERLLGYKVVALKDVSSRHPAS